MTVIPQVPPGCFLARRATGSGAFQYATFPIKGKSTYIYYGWEEISPVLAEQAEAPIAPPVVKPPAVLAKPIHKSKGRPKKNG